MMRSFLLACSQNRWLRERAPRYPFVRRAVSRFMPGETLEDALAAARSLSGSSIGTVFTLLGENITEPEEAARVTEHYLAAVRRIRELGLGTELSVKLTQLGLDLDKELCLEFEADHSGGRRKEHRVDGHGSQQLCRRYTGNLS